MELILMRHGTTQGNLERRFIGTLDVPLLPQGEELARRVGATLPAVEDIHRRPPPRRHRPHRSGSPPHTSRPRWRNRI